MLSQAISIAPQAAPAKSASTSPSTFAGTRNDTSAISAHHTAQNKPDEQKPDAFAALLSQQMADTNSASAPPPTDAQPLPSQKTTDEKSGRADHEELPSTNTTALTLTAMLLINPENRLNVAKNAGTDPAIKAQAGVSQFDLKTGNTMSADNPSAKLKTTWEKADLTNLAGMKHPARSASLDTGELSAAQRTPPATPGTSASTLTTASLAASSLPNPPLNPSANLANTSIATPLLSSAWPEAFSQKITWLSTQQNQLAELHLNPPDMGPIHVRLDISDNQASVLFSSPHSAVRDAIENSLPKLREIMADNGIMLGNASVSDQSPRDNHSTGFMNQQAHPQMNFTSGAANETSPETGSGTPSVVRHHNGMVDTFA